MQLHSTHLPTSSTNYLDKIGVGLDIGTTKVCIVVVRYNAQGIPEVIGFGYAPSKGTANGVINNIDQSVMSIAKAKKMLLQQVPFVDLSHLVVGIAGQHVSSIWADFSISRDDTNEIEQVDIENLNKEAHRVKLDPGKRIIQVIPQEYTIDGESGIIVPIGMSGIRLSAKFHIITGFESSIKNIHRCVELAGAQVEKLVLEPIASSLAVLDDKEREAGVVLIDMGGGTTDIVVIQNNIVRHSAVIPQGGNCITQDIADGCKIMKDSAEEVKIKYGACVLLEEFANEVIVIPHVARECPPIEITRHQLAQIILARMIDIFRLVLDEIINSGYARKLHAGIVLTGGGSQLAYIKDFLSVYSGMPVRIGTPNENIASNQPLFNKDAAKTLKDPSFATSIGLALYSLNYQPIHLINSDKPHPQTNTEDKEKNESPAAMGASAPAISEAPGTNTVASEIPAAAEILNEEKTTNADITSNNNASAKPRSTSFSEIFEKIGSWLKPDKDASELEDPEFDK